MGRVRGKAAKNLAKKQSKFAAKNAAIASLFGPISISGSKKGRKVKFSAPGKQKVVQKKLTKSSRTSKSEQRSSKKQNATFQLQLPSMNSAKKAAVIPWMTSNFGFKDNPSDVSTSKAKKRPRDQPRLPTDDIPEPLLAQLDRELEAFANYVRLTEAECRSRTQMIEKLKALAKSIFGGRRLGHIRFNGQPSEQPDDVRVQVFGSFATKAVCTFASDVDLALWGIVPIPQTHIAVRKMPGREAKEKQSSKEDRVEKWHKALAAIDNENAMTPDHASLEDQEKTEGKIIAREASQLFVIDRVGVPGMEAKVGPGELTRTIQNPDKNKIDLKTIGESADTAITVTSETDNEDSDSNGVDAGNESESSQDTADKLESLAANAFESKDTADEEHFVSLSSSDSESEDGCRDSGSDERDMEVSFVAPLQVAAPKPRGWKRKQVVDALGTLSRRLRKSSFSESVLLIKTARVPIIKMTSKFGFETDIAVGGHNGADTSLFAATQAKKFKSFASVVLALKVILEHQDLDKPFTGGLGSYKLYVMVAYHLQRHLALGGSDRPGEILLSFLFRFGQVKGHNVDEHTRTELSQEIPLSGDDGSSADLSNVFRLQQCVHLFQCCWGRLWKCMKPIGKHDECRSLLASLVDVSRLHLERQHCIEKATVSLDKMGPDIDRKRRKHAQQQDDDPNTDSSFIRADVSAEQLMAGYGVDSAEDLPMAKRARKH